MKRRGSTNRFNLEETKPQSPMGTLNSDNRPRSFYEGRIQIDPKSKNIIDTAQTKLQERLDLISAKLNRAKATQLNDDDLENEDILNNFKLSGKVQFYDENWKETLEKAKTEKDFNTVLASFVQNFTEINAQKVDLTELPPKSDRQYVDSLIELFSKNISEMYKKSVNQSYSQLRDQIQQAEFNLDVVSQQFEQNIDTLRKDLTRFKKQLSAQADTQYKKEQKVKELKLKLQHNTQEIPQYFPLMVPLTEPRRPAIVRDKYRPKTHTALPSLPSIHAQLVSHKFAKDLPPPSNDGAETWSDWDDMQMFDHSVPFAQ
ncbi:hypothetical protein TVAG_161560 [Trichomonas vaginalis G3]|uniref:Uncharacterized protein n=1 Tax=Trichomonas vaginalis (strain ATCC PRA-98 / G3) TaxID=412133 RepID=A2EUM9_TRIV3|nr:hypothetical protein TVAGG3_0255600 [Trichomonas vaginalis G3]EAY03617.1 hypothetical protein TVAG_161560 [Trichomonas vaginalis G3]KAI5524711.1 hypothetical protein TVAGG3_0255600 [Trichomonas vaginalis G3]|eukprot:XP_001315840.1 hypothetical protein [Trichomonas vaginalis G3]